jgi:hypothetical protein
MAAEWHAGFQRPKILTIRGCQSFLVQDVDLQDGGVKVAVIDDGGPRKQTIKSVEGSIKSPLCMTTDCQELFAVILPSTIMRNLRQVSECSLGRWKIVSAPRIAIEARSPVSPRPEFPISKSSFSRPGRLSTASVRVDRQSYALIAQYDGRIYRTLLEGRSSSALSP